MGALISRCNAAWESGINLRGLLRSRVINGRYLHEGLYSGWAYRNIPARVEAKDPMQPTKEENDFRFYQDAVHWWHNMAARYLEYGDDDSANRCMNRAELNAMRRDEATGIGPLVWGPEIYARGA